LKNAHALQQRQNETSAKPAVRRSGVSAERRKPFEIEGFGFLPKAATLLLQRFQNAMRPENGRENKRDEKWQATGDR
jgi:hypothetical protein